MATAAIEDGANIEQLLLSTLDAHEVIVDTWAFALANGLDHQAVVGALKSLLVDSYVIEEPLSATLWTLTDEGKDIVNHGSPEYQVFAAVPAGEAGKSMTELQKELPEASKIGLGPCMKNKWLKKQGDVVLRIAESVKDETAEVLRQVQEGSGELPEEELKNLKRRKLVQQIVRKSYKISKGPSFRSQRVRKMADLTKEMLGSRDEVAIFALPFVTLCLVRVQCVQMTSGTHWSEVTFKNVNLKSMGAQIHGGNLHPLLKVRAELRRILQDMGFEEMPTNKWVESSFWNFDALFQPQSHPSRDAHDTFFMKDPASANSVPEDYYERVKTTHETGGYGSIGYGCVFKREEAMKNILRTHTTAISAQMLYKLANQPGGFTPKKYFSIDRVFRNEAMDATHLCEFHQVEGLVADRNLTLGNLIAVIRTFFEKIGITQLRFKPAFNPYTEPSMEIFGYHPELKKWTELGNSGMFRPEMLRPMGIPEDVRVIAWGISLERPTMIKYHIDNIRDLFGHKADLLKQQNAPIARF
jgi:phenylalanyl-tRNA synthetase alpha chain